MDEFERQLIGVRSSLRAFAVSLSGRHDRADDLVQITMLKALHSRNSFEMGTNIKAWLFTILRNEFYSQLRKKSREVQDTDGAFTEHLSTHASQHGHMDTLDMKRALALLPKNQRDAVMMVGALGYTYEEAAEAAKCAEGTMKSRVHRAREMLMHLLDENHMSYRMLSREGIARRKEAIETPIAPDVLAPATSQALKHKPDFAIGDMGFMHAQTFTLSTGQEVRIFAAQ